MNSNEKLKTMYLFIIKRVFALTCIFATLGMVIWQFYQYGLDEDETQVEYQRFSKRDIDVYPSISFCLTNAINEERLKRYSENFTTRNYAEFLMGEYQDPKMLNVDYENVITHWREYILLYGHLRTDPKSTYAVNISYAKKEIDPNSRDIMTGFSQLTFVGLNCFTIDLLLEKHGSLITFFLALDPKVLGQEGRPSFDFFDSPLVQNRFIVHLHYPNQMLRYFAKGLPTMGYWPASKEKSYAIRFTVRDIEVLERRDKRNARCDSNFLDFDQLITKFVLTQMNCKPPYWNSSLSLPFCSNQPKSFSKKMNLAIKYLSISTFTDRYSDYFLRSLPCRGLENIYYDYVDEKFPNNMLSTFPGLNGSLIIYFDFKSSTYKELKHVRSFNEQTLIGNCIA